MREPILRVRNLSVDYPISIGTVRAVRDVSFDLYPGEALGLVGESGCGKSTLGLSLLKLARPPGRISSGEILFKDNDIAAMSERELRSVRGNDIAMVFQNPLTSLNPLYRIDQQFLETIKLHRPNVKRADALALAEQILDDLGVERKRLYDYPHQLSGGMRQRIMIGLGLILDPEIIVADEPTTSLDVIVEAGFIDLLNRLRKKYELAIILVTHNLGMVAEIADRLAVMYSGLIVEVASADDIYHEPFHPYTHGLINCVPNIDLDQEELVTMPGDPPDLVAEIVGCPFADRCPHVMDVCRKSEPKLSEIRDGSGSVACHLYDHEEVPPWRN